MDYNNVNEIKHLSTSGYTDDCADRLVTKSNELLKQGWKIIDTYKTCHEHELFPNQQDFHIILGRMNYDLWVDDQE